VQVGDTLCTRFVRVLEGSFQKGFGNGQLVHDYIVHDADGKKRGR
jgi:hypothetical protein